MSTSVPAPARSGRRTGLAAYLVIGLLTAALTGYLFWQPGGSDLANIIDDVAEAVTAALGSGVCLAAAARLGRQARHHRDARSAAMPWLLLGLGIASWCAGQLLTCWYEVIQGVDTPFPGWADVGFLGFPVPAVAAIWLLSRGGTPRRRHRSLIDGCVMVGAMVVIGWETALGQVWTTRSGGPLGVTVALAYPATDVILATAAFLAVGHAPRERRLVLRLLGAGMTAMAVADSFFSYIVNDADYGRWQGIDAAWPLAFLLMGLAALRAVRPAPGRAVRESQGDEADRRSGIDQQTWFELLLPYVPLVAALVLLFGRGMATGRIDRVADVAAAATTLLVFVRQLLVLVDNRGLVRLVEHQAFHDPLTGLANRALFADRLQHAGALHRRSRHPFAVLFCDLDDFKRVNDTLGHPVGDRLLVLLAERVKAALGPADTVARLGGDEFAILLEEPDADPVEVAMRLLQAMDEDFAPYGHVVAARMSVGLILSDEETLEPAEYLRRADLALYDAKAQGKNTFSVYEPVLELRVARAATVPTPRDGHGARAH